MPAVEPELAQTLAALEAIWGGLQLDHFAFGVGAACNDLDGTPLAVIAQEWMRDALYVDATGQLYRRDGWGAKAPILPVAESLPRFIERLAHNSDLEGHRLCARVDARVAAPLADGLQLQRLEGASGDDSSWWGRSDLFMCDGRPFFSRDDVTTIRGSLHQVIAALRLAERAAWIDRDDEEVTFELRSAEEAVSAPALGEGVLPLLGSSGVIDLRDDDAILVYETHAGRVVTRTRWAAEGLSQTHFGDAAALVRPYLSPRAQQALPAVSVSHDPRHRLSPDAAAELLFRLDVLDPEPIVALEQVLGGMQLGEDMSLGLRYAARDGDRIDFGVVSDCRIQVDEQARLYFIDDIDGTDMMIAEDLPHFLEREVLQERGPSGQGPYFRADRFVGAMIADAIAATTVAELSDAAMRLWSTGSVEVHESAGREGTLVTYVQATSLAALGDVIAELGSMPAVYSTPFKEVRLLLEEAGLEVKRLPERNYEKPVVAEGRIVVEREDLSRDELIALIQTTGNVDSEDVVVLDAAARHPAADARVLQLLATKEVAYPLWAVVPRAIAMNPATPLPLLERLARNGCPEVREGVAANPNAPPSLIDPLCRDADAKVRRSAANHPSATPAVLRALVSDPEKWLRLAVAAHDNTPEDALVALAADRDGAVAHDLASRESLPVAIARRVAYHPFALRYHTAAHPSLPPSVLEELASSSIADCRRGVASNPVTQVELLRSLLGDVEPEVRNLALGHPSLPDEAVPSALSSRRQQAQRDHPIVTGPWQNPPTLSPHERLGTLIDRKSPSKGAWASHPTYPVCLLAELVDDPATLVRYSIATHPWVPADVLARLARCAGSTARGSIARHERTPIPTLEALSNDEAPRVRAAAAANARLPRQHLVRLAQDDDLVREQVAGRADCPHALLGELARHPDPHVRRGVAQNAHAPPALLGKLAADPDDNIRAHVVLNPSSDVADSLRADSARIVRDAVIWRLG